MSELGFVGLIGFVGLSPGCIRQIESDDKLNVYMEKGLTQTRRQNPIHPINPSSDRQSTGSNFNMAAYEHLPIFKKTMDLTVFMEQTVSRFSRYHKYTLGTELRTLCHDALALIMEANSTRERQPVLLRLRVVLEKIKIHLIIAREVQAYHNRNSFAQATEMVVDLCRQNEGWIKSTGTRSPEGKKGGGRNLHPEG